KIVNKPQTYRIRSARSRCHVMKILSGRGRRNIWQRNKLQQRLRCRADIRRIDRIRHTVELILLACLWIENLNRISSVILRGGKVAIALGKRRYGGIIIIWRTAARPIPPPKEEPFVPAVEN